MTPLRAHFGQWNMFYVSDRRSIRIPRSPCNFARNHRRQRGKRDDVRSRGKLSNFSGTILCAAREPCESLLGETRFFGHN